MNVKEKKYRLFSELNDDEFNNFIHENIHELEETFFNREQEYEDLENSAFLLTKRLGLDNLEFEVTDLSNVRPLIMSISDSALETIRVLLHSPVYKLNDEKLRDTFEEIEDRLLKVSELTEDLSYVSLEIHDDEVNCFIQNDYTLCSLLDDCEIIERIDSIINYSRNSTLRNLAKSYKLKINFIDMDDLEYDFLDEIDEAFDKFIDEFLDSEHFKPLIEYINKEINNLIDEFTDRFKRMSDIDYLKGLLINDKDYGLDEYGNLTLTY